MPNSPNSRRVWIANIWSGSKLCSWPYLCSGQAKPSGFVATWHILYPRMQYLITCSCATSSYQPFISALPWASCLALIFLLCLHGLPLSDSHWKFSKLGHTLNLWWAALGRIMHYCGKSSRKARRLSMNFASSMQGWQRGLDCCTGEREVGKKYIQ